MEKIESEIWYLENLGTKNIQFLLEGNFKIGRKSNNDLVVNGKYKRYSSNRHCIIKLQNNNYIRLLNRVSFFPLHCKLSKKKIDFYVVATFD